MSHKSKKKSKAKQTKSATSSTTPSKTMASEDKSNPEVFITEDSQDNLIFNAKSLIATEAPMWQKVALAASLLLLAAISLYIIIATITGSNTAERDARFVPPSSTPGGSTTITNDLNAPVTQQTNNVQAAPSINSGGGGEIQPGSNTLQDQSSDLQ
jgi:hypothetical protein